MHRTQVDGDLDWETTQAIVERSDNVFRYFDRRYGVDRAYEICMAITPTIRSGTFEDAVRVGQKWHAANILMRRMNGKA